MTTEDSLREILGYGTPQITFLGHDFAIHPEGLMPLLRYALRSVPSQTRAEPLTDREAEQMMLAASYQLLEDCLEDFRAFTTLALTGKAQIDDILGAVQNLTAHYCARSYWPAMRLISYIASHLEEIDGQLIRACGRGVAGLSAREACNLALAICLDGRDEEDRAVFLGDLNYEGNPDAEALALVRQMQAARAQATAQAAEAAGG